MENATVKIPPTPTPVDTTPISKVNTTTATTGTDDQETTKGETKEKVIKKSKMYLPKAVAVLLGIQGLSGIYRSLNFTFVIRPQLEQQLLLDQLTQDDINGIANRAVIMMVSTVVSLFFASRLAFLKSKAARAVNVAIGLSLFLGNALISTYLTQSGSVGILSSIYIGISDTLLFPFRALFSLLPF